MKIKHLKEIIIGDAKFQMKWDKKSDDGEFSYPWKKEKAFIRIGCRDEKHSIEHVLNVLIHELKEIIQIEQATRFKRIDESCNYEFHYSHKEHTELCSRLAGLLSQFIK